MYRIFFAISDIYIYKMPDSVLFAVIRYKAVSGNMIDKVYLRTVIAKDVLYALGNILIVYRLLYRNYTEAGKSVVYTLNIGVVLHLRNIFLRLCFTAYKAGKASVKDIVLYNKVLEGI